MPPLVEEEDAAFEWGAGSCFSTSPTAGVSALRFPRPRPRVEEDDDGRAVEREMPNARRGGVGGGGGGGPEGGEEMLC